MTSCTELKADKKASSLANRLLTESGISISQMQQILGWRWNDNGNKPAGSKDGDACYGEFRVADLDGLDTLICESVEFANVLKLVDRKRSCSSAGDYTVREWGFNILGDAGFGQRLTYQHIDADGNLEVDVNSNIDGNFDSNQVQVVLVNHVLIDCYNNYEYVDSWILYIYIPSKDRK